MDSLIVKPQPKTRNIQADLVQPSLLSLLPAIEDLPADPKPLVLRTQSAPNDRRQSLKRFQCPEDMGYCARCDAYMEKSMFRKDNNKGTNGLSRYCKDCYKVYEDTQREQRMHKMLKRNYGITPEQYDALHDAQNGLCAICGQPETKVMKGIRCVLAVDHDHVTGKIRGLLCTRCNAGLGQFGDNIESLAKAIDYLKKD